MEIKLPDITANVHFMWDMSPKDYDKLMTPLSETMNDISDYMGAVFFGNIKLEFIRNDISGIGCNCFEYAAEDYPGQAYSYLEDGTPYEERYYFGDELFVPDLETAVKTDLPTFEDFAENIEHQIINLLERFSELLPSAIFQTIPDKWYPCGHPYKVTIVREA